MTGAARPVLRLLAVAIAIAGVIDPAWTTTRPEPRDLVAIVAMEGTAAVDRLEASAAGWRLTTRQAHGPSLPCGAHEQCVVIADGSIDVDVPTDTSLPVSLIAVSAAGAPNVEVRRVTVSSTHASAAGSARVELVRSGAIGSTEVRLTDNGAIIGAATHQWETDTTAAIDVPWWPIQDGARVLHIEAIPVPGERTTVDNQIDVGVEVISSRASVLVFDARPSWSSTFVRRALEDDPRFLVGHRARVAPALTSGTSNARLDAAALDQVSVLVVGGPDALTADEVNLLDRFVRVRGGTLVLLPEQRITGPVQRLVTGAWTEHLTPTPERVGPLYATEILRSKDEAIGAVLGRSGSMAAIVSMPAGYGQVVISGAMDAWRQRDRDAGAFDRFWRSLAAEGAAAGAPLSLTVDDTLVARRGRARFTLRARRMTPMTSADASAIVRCGDQPAGSVRLWPSAAIGEFNGEMTVSSSGPCRIEAAIDGRQAGGGFASAEQPRRGASETLTRLVTAVGKMHGVVVNAGEEAELVRAIERDRQPSSQVVSTRPARSPWWMIPFAGCLTIEWFLRRRDGLR
jgi:hypothetical protein